jgi:hypothetical protein
VDQNAGLWLQLEILQAESNKFGDSEARRKAQVEHRPVSDSQSVCRVRSVQQELRLLLGQVGNDSSISLLDRDGQHALNLFHRRGQSVLHIPHKGPDRRQADVSAAGAIVASAFQMIQEVHDQRSVHLLEVEFRGLNFEAFTGVTEE